MPLLTKAEEWFTNPWDVDYIYDRGTVINDDRTVLYIYDSIFLIIEQ